MENGVMFLSPYVVWPDFFSNTWLKSWWTTNQHTYINIPPFPACGCKYFCINEVKKTRIKLDTQVSMLDTYMCSTWVFIMELTFEVWSGTILNDGWTFRIVLSQIFVFNSSVTRSRFNLYPVDIFVFVIWRSFFIPEMP